MRIDFYRTLPLSPRNEIRWPGADAVIGWLDRGEFAAMHVWLCENEAQEDLEFYEVSTPDRPTDWSLDVQETLPSRAVLMRLLLQEWAQRLHDDRINVVLSDEPRAKSRLRSYRGLLSADCRAIALSFHQAEFELSEDQSVIINKVEADSVGFQSCFELLGDTFKAFGVYGWPGPPQVDTGLGRIGVCFEYQRRLWQWESSRVLPVICTGPASLFFVQGVANETSSQLILYLPADELESHLQVAQTLFGAVSSAAS